MEHRPGACQAAVNQSAGDGQDHAQWLDATAHGTEQKPDQEQAKIEVILCLITALHAISIHAEASVKP